MNKKRFFGANKKFSFINFSFYSSKYDENEEIKELDAHICNKLKVETNLYFKGTSLICEHLKDNPDKNIKSRFLDRKWYNFGYYN